MVLPPLLKMGEGGRPCSLFMGDVVLYSRGTSMNTIEKTLFSSGISKLNFLSEIPTDDSKDQGRIATVAVCQWLKFGVRISDQS